VNDVYGHSTGDLLLQTAAWRLAQQLETTDKLYRQNGDEFWLLLHTDDTASVNKLAEKLLLQLSQYTDELLKDINLTASIGICRPENYTEKAETLLQQANIALHDAKKNSGYQIRHYNSTMQWL
jgi:diguanylate cyclase (GGDEF)-like protein